VTRFRVPGTVRITPAIMVLYSCGKYARRRTCVLLATQHENDKHNDDDEDYRPDTYIHRFFLSWRRPAVIADEVPGAIFDPATLT
jgi:hypothetical protein